MKVIAAAFVLASLGAVACASAVTDQMEFPNKMGTVLFSHEKHKDLADGNCKVCHDRTGAVPNFGKAFAHTVCIGCHEPEAGKAEGPITCDGCHAAI